MPFIEWIQTNLLLWSFILTVITVVSILFILKFLRKLGGKTFSVKDVYTVLFVGVLFIVLSILLKKPLLSIYGLFWVSAYTSTLCLRYCSIRDSKFNLSTDALHHQPIFWLVISLPAAIAFGLSIPLSVNTEYCFTSECYDNFIDRMSLPFKIFLYVIIPASVMVARFHRTTQTQAQIEKAETQISNSQKQIKLSEDKNARDYWLTHRKEYIEYIEECKQKEIFGYDILDPLRTYRAIYPKNTSTSPYHLPDREVIREFCTLYFMVKNYQKRIENLAENAKKIAIPAIIELGGGTDAFTEKDIAGNELFDFVKFSKLRDVVLKESVKSWIKTDSFKNESILPITQRILMIEDKIGLKHISIPTVVKGVQIINIEHRVKHLSNSLNLLYEFEESKYKSLLKMIRLFDINTNSINPDLNRAYDIRDISRVLESELITSESKYTFDWENALKKGLSSKEFLSCLEDMKNA
ncbi:hypothetical protein EZV61_11695 [Corallincola luteus]|uniref:Uncharacterized protein n=1 Tax=Corallincola luteus TaxID=1775177 RepID=A0ABY2AKP4_9GAMM|nr:hypothetical protein [Corallincola luteus]TCI02946.1 hypothetical protein EZV61_11695 [Corallincola luteus]